MPVYLVGYDAGAGREGPDMAAAVGTLGTNWRCLASAWLLVHPGPAKVIWDALAANVAAGDRLFVAVMGQYDAVWWGLDHAAADWAGRHL
jgi:hypothetical protein